MQQIIILLTIAFLLTAFPHKALLAHEGGEPILLIDGKNLQINSIHGLAPNLLTEEVGSDTYVVGRPIQFDVNLEKLAPGSVVRWKWGRDEAGYEEGDKLQHTYVKPGTYIITLQAKDPSKSSQFEDYHKVQVGVVPKQGYIMPSAKVDVGFEDAKNGWNVVYRANVTKDPSVNITSYKWILGDGTSLNGQEVKHTYSKGFYQAFPLLIASDSNNLTAVLAFEVNENNNNKFTASSLPSSPNSISLGNIEEKLPSWTYLVALPAAVAVIFIISITLRKKKTS